MKNNNTLNYVTQNIELHAYRQNDSMFVWDQLLYFPSNQRRRKKTGCTRISCFVYTFFVKIGDYCFDWIKLRYKNCTVQCTLHIYFYCIEHLYLYNIQYTSNCKLYNTHLVVHYIVHLYLYTVHYTSTCIVDCIIVIIYLYIVQYIFNCKLYRTPLPVHYTVYLYLYTVQYTSSFTPYSKPILVHCAVHLCTCTLYGTPLLLLYSIIILGEEV